MEFIGVRTLEYGIPLDRANINNTQNVCTCEPLSREVKKMVSGEASCVRTTSDADTYDISWCDTRSWNCFDGILDISNVTYLVTS